MKHSLGLLLVVLQSVTASPSEQPRQTWFRDFLITGERCSHCPDMATIPGGRFLLGSRSGEGHNDELGPGGMPVSVQIPPDLAFSIGEITRQEFAAYAAANPGTRYSDECSGLIGDQFLRQAGTGWTNPGFPQSEDHPVVCVTWQMAKDYTVWLSKITGQHYRLPTEAEWEHAAGARSAFRFWWGDAMLPNRVNCLHEWCDTRYPNTAPSRSFRSNPYGLHDMLGNVWEWMEDCYRADAYRRHRNYPLPVSGAADCKRVIRGGSWAENYWSLRTSNREGWKADSPLNDIGFRVVRVGKRLPL